MNYMEEDIDEDSPTLTNERENKFILEKEDMFQIVLNIVKVNTEENIDS